MSARLVAAALTVASAAFWLFRTTLLPGLVGRADDVLFPVDCISHDAVVTIKRLCRQLEKPYRPLRTASLATLVAALAMPAEDHADALAAS